MKKNKDLDSLLDAASSSKNKMVNIAANVKQKKSNENQKEILIFSLYEEDNELLTAMKMAINREEITSEDVYNMYDRPEGYNMIYSLQKKNEISWIRVKRWCKLLDLEPRITFEPIKHPKKK